MKRRIFSFLCAALLLLALSLCVCAEETEQTGSISITMYCQSEGVCVPGGTMTLHRVADLVDGSWVFTDAFADCGLSMDDLSIAAAGAYAAYAAENGIWGTVEPIDENGFVSFAQLPAGLYLLIQEEAAEGYCALSPFFVTIPNDGKYDVDASPKISLTPEETTPPETEPPTDPEPTDPKLPQTGQMNWPVPVLAAGGLLLFVMGMYMTRAGRKE